MANCLEDWVDCVFVRSLSTLILVKVLRSKLDAYKHCKGLKISFNIHHLGVFRGRLIRPGWFSLTPAMNPLLRPGVVGLEV